MHNTGAVKKSILFLLLLPALWASAQNVGYTTKWVPVVDSLVFDSISSAPGSLVIYNNQDDSISSSNYRFDWYTSTLVWVQKPEVDSVKLQYYRLNLRPRAKRKLRNTNLIQDELAIEYEERIQQSNNSQSTPLGSGDELQKVGSISRGVAFGNNQNLSVNSNLDLQLSGNLTDDYVLSAALSDRNIPIQPEGTTSNIQEFDQVYVNVTGNGTNATIGDFFVNSDPNNYFLKTYKKTQGISASQVFKSSSTELVVGANIGITRGRFARNTFNGDEGNQGPYRLTGENGELFIIVIAGTERVYINGSILERGEQNQYIIDYNSGEITFTPKQLITSNDRIVVEFQYADNSYERSLSHGYVTSKQKNSSWAINYYSEQDNRNKPFFTTFSAEDVQTLAQAGDNIELAFKLAEDTSNISESTVRYEKRDTIVDGVVYEDVYRQTENENRGIYRVTYSLVGQGNGNYVEDASLINGRVYQWVAPVNGVPQGNYAPIIRLIAPKRTRLITGRYESSFKDKFTLFSEVGLSNHDENTISALDTDDDQGLGARLGVGYSDSLFKKRLAIKTGLVSEYTSSNFTTIERFRGVEFTRTWNRQLSNQSNILNSKSDLFLNGGNLSFGYKNLEVGHELNLLNLDQFFNGVHNRSNLKYQHKYLSINAVNEQVATQANPAEEEAFTGNSSLQQLVVETPTRYFKAGYELLNDVNTYRFTASDSLLAQSYGSYENSVYVRNHDSSKVEYLLSLGRRSILTPIENELLTDNRSTDLQSEFGFGIKNNFTMNLNTTYRIFDKVAGDADSLDENTLLNRLEYRVKALKGFLQTNSYYQIGTGRERQFEIQYLFVGQGLGDFVWADINGNGKQDLGEFRPQEFTGQGDFVRTVVNSNRYVNAISNEFYQTVNIVPMAVWGDAKGVKGLLSKFSNQATGSINRKTKDENNINQINPFNLDINEESLISAQAQLRNSLYFNRLSSKFGLEYTWFNLSNKNLFVYGFEGNEKTENLLQMRWNLSSIFSLFPTYSDGQIQSTSESFANKNYILNYNQTKLKAQLQKGTSFRFAVNGELYNGDEPGDSSASVQRSLLGLECSYSQASKGAVTAKFNYIQVDFEGDKNSPLGFNMLNGLQPGTNFTWSVIANYQVSRQAQLGINYEARYSTVNNLIQTGSVNARWLF